MYNELFVVPIFCVTWVHQVILLCLLFNLIQQNEDICICHYLNFNTVEFEFEMNFDTI